MATFARSGLERSTAGFSLVEVTIAVGIVAFGFVSLLGLIPTGLNVMHQAMDATTNAAIIQQVINDAQETNFNNLTNNSVTTGSTSPIVNNDRYFDDQGTEVPSTATASIYQVHTVVTPATTIPSNQTLTNLATVTIQIVNNPGHKTVAVDPNTKLWSDSGFTITNYSGYVSQAQAKYVPPAQ